MMKKRILLLLSICLIVFSSCSKNIVYDVKLSEAAEAGVFKDSALAGYTDTQKKTYENSEIETIKIGKKEIKAYMIEQTLKDEEIRNTSYLDENKQIKYIIYSSSNRFIATPYGDNQFLKEISDSELTEEKLLSYIKSYIFEYVSDFDYVQYTYSCETQLKCFSDDATWNENREGFHISTTENESVKYYVVEFVKYASNIATGSHIRIICDELGNIITFGYLIFDVDWGTPNIDDAILSDSIENFLKQNINDEYKFISFEIKSQRLIYEDNEIKLHVEVIVALKHLNEEFSTSCSFKLNLNNT